MHRFWYKQKNEEIFFSLVLGGPNLVQLSIKTAKSVAPGGTPQVRLARASNRFEKWFQKTVHTKGLERCCETCDSDFGFW